MMQELISRLEHYQEIEPVALHRAIAFIDDHIIPTVTRHSISGHAMIRT